MTFLSRLNWLSDEQLTRLCAEFELDVFRPPPMLLGCHVLQGLIRWVELQGQVEHLIARVGEYYGIPP